MLKSQTPTLEASSARPRRRDSRPRSASRSRSSQDVALALLDQPPGPQHRPDDQPRRQRGQRPDRPAHSRALRPAAARHPGQRQLGAAHRDRRPHRVPVEHPGGGENRRRAAVVQGEVEAEAGVDARRGEDRVHRHDHRRPARARRRRPAPDRQPPPLRRLGQPGAAARRQAGEHRRQPARVAADEERIADPRHDRDPGARQQLPGQRRERRWLALGLHRQRPGEPVGGSGPDADSAGEGAGDRLDPGVDRGPLVEIGHGAVLAIGEEAGEQDDAERHRGRQVRRRRSRLASPDLLAVHAPWPPWPRPTRPAGIRSPT